VEGNERREHGEVVEGAGGEGDEHRGVKAELGEAASGLGGGRRRLAPTGPRWQRAAEHSGGGMRGNEGKVEEVVLCSTWRGDKAGTTSTVATDGVRLPPRHHLRCRTCTQVTGASRLNGRYG
jgi:hypothetical protein